MTARLMFLHALSPVHAGTGQSLGAIDLAIARDRATDMPYIPGSSIKGTLRARCASDRADRVHAIFGPETENASDHAGAVLIGDANLLLLPARSVAGTFAWVTSPFLLARFLRDAREAGHKTDTWPDLRDIDKLERCRTDKACQLIVRDKGRERVVFEDLDLTPSPHSARRWAKKLSALLFPDDEFWQKSFRQRLCVVHDDIMTFLARHAVDVSARIRLNPDTHTVADGGLWYEENLPCESILTSLVVAAPNKKTGLDSRQILKTIEDLTRTSIQLGGNATVGRGRCRVVLSAGGKR